MSKEYKTGDIVEGVVSGIQPYGAFVNLKDGGTGLVHISEISDDYVRNIEDYIRLGDVANFYVIEYNSLAEHAKLSLKQIAEDSKKKRKSPLAKQRKKELNTNKKYFPFIEEMIKETMDADENQDTFVRIDASYTLLDGNLKRYQHHVDRIDEMIRNKDGIGGEYLGWLDYPNEFSEKELLKIQRLGQEIREKYDAFVLVGIGGSYLGARAAIEMINGAFQRSKTKIIYLGNTFSANYTKKVLKYLEGKNYCVNVISKSGSTLETAIAFRLLKDQMIQRWGVEETKKRIIVTTDKDNGQLRELVNKEGYTSFVIPEDILGRYSVITPVGLLPIAAAGIDIMQVMLGAKRACLDCKTSDITKNPSYQYAVLRRVIGWDKPVELFVTYDPQMIMFAEWWKQLFGESEGKDGKGIFPASVNYSTDLHSLGQFVQDGTKILFETGLLCDETESLFIPHADDGQIALKSVEGRDLGEINKIVSKATVEAHNIGKVPNIVIHFPKMDAYAFGYLVYFFMFACVAASYMINVNPCDQQSVEIYKSKVRELLR